MLMPVPAAAASERVAAVERADLLHFLLRLNATAAPPPSPPLPNVRDLLMACGPSKVSLNIAVAVNHEDGPNGARREVCAIALPDHPVAGGQGATLLGAWHRSSLFGHSQRLWALW